MGKVLIDLNTSVISNKNLFNAKSGGLVGKIISDDMFGVNFLSSYETGDSEIGGASFDDIIRAIGNVPRPGIDAAEYSSTPVSTLRFPGGALTENFYANSRFILSVDTPVNNGSKFGINVKDFIKMAAENGSNMTSVIPTFRYLGSDGLTDLDKAELSKYIYDTLTEALVQGISVKSFELGNEYWNKMTVDKVKDVGMTAAEYGEIAADQAVVIKQAIDLFEANNKLLINSASSWETPKILLQMGAPWGESSDTSRLKAQNDSQTIIDAFSTSEQRSAIDGFIAHRYEAKIDHVSDPFVAVKPLHFNALPEMLTDTGWKDFDSMTLAVTEWNVDQRSTETGLRSFSLLVGLMGEMVSLGVDAADFWSAAARSKFPMSRFEGGKHTADADFAGLTFTGEAFRMMNESLRGKQAVQLYEKSDGKLRSLDGNKFDLAGGDNLRTNVEAFSDGKELVLFVSNLSGQSDKVTLDISGMLGRNACHAWGTLVESSSSNLMDNTAAPIVTNMNLIFKNGVLRDFSLGAYETLRITITLGKRGADVFGYDAADNLVGSIFNDTISGRDGNDRLNGLVGNDIIYGGQGFDHLDGGAGNDSVFGGNGNDTLTGGLGNDRLFGGDGNDTAIFAGKAKIRVDLEVTNIQNTGAGLDVLSSIENVTTGNGIDKIYGNNLDNRLTSGGGNDLIFGRDGNDTLLGEMGNDVIYGGQGFDAIFGGAGHDRLFGETGNDTLDGGLGNDLLLGGDGHDSLIGGAGHDRLFGGAGNDTLDGGFGNDRLYGGAGADVFVFEKKSGRDVAYDFQMGVDKIELTNPGETFGGLSIVNVRNGVAITHEPGDVITLVGVKAWQLSESDFIFA